MTNLQIIPLQQASQTLFSVLNTIIHEDTIGIIYQSLLLEAGKTKQGSYYTPNT